MRKYAQDDYAYYAIEFYDKFGNLVIPDWNASLYWEFRDADGVLQFTATTISAPALQAAADYVYLEDLPLTGWAVGVVQVRAYAQLGGIDFEPYPLVASAFEIVDAGDLVEQLRTLLHLDDNSQDALLLTLIQSAAGYAEKYLGRSLLTQSRSRQFQAPSYRGLSASALKWPTLLLTYPPVASVTSVQTVDQDGNITTLDSSQYWLDDVSDPPELRLTSASWSNLLRINYEAGYGANYDSLPDAIQRGILRHAAHLFKYRGDCDIGESAVASGAVGEYRIYRVVRR